MHVGGIKARSSFDQGFHNFYKVAKGKDNSIVIEFLNHILH